MRTAALVMLVLLIASPAICGPTTAVPRPCIPDPGIPAESLGPLSIPFDVPVWPTLLKTEVHIVPWVSLGTVSICLPGSCKSWDIPFPSFSLKPLPLWFPWLRPLDVEFKDCDYRWVP